MVSQRRHVPNYQLLTFYPCFLPRHHLLKVDAHFLPQPPCFAQWNLVRLLCSYSPAHTLWSTSQSYSHTAHHIHCDLQVRATAIQPITYIVIYKSELQPYSPSHTLWSTSQSYSHTAQHIHCDLQVRATVIHPNAYIVIYKSGQARHSSNCTQHYCTSIILSGSPYMEHPPRFSSRSTETEHFQDSTRNTLLSPELWMAWELFSASPLFPELKRIRNYNVTLHYIILHYITFSPCGRPVWVRLRMRESHAKCVRLGRSP